MPNWCSTNVYFYGKHKDLTAFAERINKTFSNKERVNYNWLGYLLQDLDIKDDNISCRGWVQWDDISDFLSGKQEYFSMDIEDAWAPHIEVFRKMIEVMGLKDEVTFLYSAEEPGCELYITNDDRGIIFGGYIMRIYTDSGYSGKLIEYCEYPECETELIATYNELFHTTYDTWDEIQEDIKIRYKADPNGIYEVYKYDIDTDFPPNYTLI